MCACVCLSLYLPVCMSICLSVCLSVCYFMSSENVKFMHELVKTSPHLPIPSCPAPSPCPASLVLTCTESNNNTLQSIYIANSSLCHDIIPSHTLAWPLPLLSPMCFSLHFSYWHTLFYLPPVASPLPSVPLNPTLPSSPLTFPVPPVVQLRLILQSLSFGPPPVGPSLRILPLRSIPSFSLPLPHISIPALSSGHPSQELFFSTPSPASSLARPCWCWRYAAEVSIFRYVFATSLYQVGETFNRFSGFLTADFSKWEAAKGRTCTG